MEAVKERVFNPYEEFNPNDMFQLNQMIDMADQFDMPLVGENEDGEMVMTEVTSEFVKMSTYQSNGWIRINYFYPDGIVEEMYDRD